MQEIKCTEIRLEFDHRQNIAQAYLQYKPIKFVNLGGVSGELKLQSTKRLDSFIPRRSGLDKEEILF